MKLTKKIELYINYLIKNKKKIHNSCQLRQYQEILKDFENIYKKINIIKKLFLKLYNLQSKQKTFQLQIKKLLNIESTEIQNLKKKSKKNKNQITDIEQNILDLYKKINIRLIYFPNILSNQVKIKDQIIKFNQEKLLNKKYNYKQICILLKDIDFITASNISGPRNVIYKNECFLLMKALKDFFINYALNLKYNPILCPLLIKNQSAFNCGLLPKFKNEIFQTLKDNLFLIPTAEASLINLHCNQKINKTQRYFSLTPCFRREAGNYGTKAGGLFRLHQFYKCELVIFCNPQESEKEHQKMLKDITQLIELLDLDYRILLNSGINTAFQSYKTYDLECSLPSNRKKFIEISSCSNTYDFQSRRTNTTNKNNQFIHILNGSCLPIERLLLLILENNQTKKGIKIPKILQKYYKKDFIYYKL